MKKIFKFFLLPLPCFLCMPLNSCLHEKQNDSSEKINSRTIIEDDKEYDKEYSNEVDTTVGKYENEKVKKLFKQRDDSIKTLQEIFDYLRLTAAQDSKQKIARLRSYLQSNRYLKTIWKSNEFDLLNFYPFVKNNKIEERKVYESWSLLNGFGVKELMLERKYIEVFFSQWCEKIMWYFPEQEQLKTIDELKKIYKVYKENNIENILLIDCYSFIYDIAGFMYFLFFKGEQEIEMEEEKDIDKNIEKIFDRLHCMFSMDMSEDLRNARFIKYIFGYKSVFETCWKKWKLKDESII